MTKKDKLQGILMAYGLSGIDLKYATSDILSLFGVSGTLDLEKMKKKFDELLENFSVEDFEEWRKSKG